MKNKYLRICVKCGGTTSSKYAREHDGLCKECVTGIHKEPSNWERRNATIIDCGYDAYAREEGHYD